MAQKQTDDQDTSTLLRRIADNAGFDEAIAGLAEQVFDYAVEANAISKTKQQNPDGTLYGNETRYPPEVYPAAVYAAARIRNIPTKPEEVADGFVDDHDNVANHYKQMLSAIPFDVEARSPTDWVRRICDDLALGDDFVEQATGVCQDATENNLHIGKGTSGFAAAVVFATANMRNDSVKQDDIADVASVSPTTIRNNYRPILNANGELTEPGDPKAIDKAINDTCDQIDDLPESVRSEALQLAVEADENDANWLQRTDPAGVAAGIVYVISVGDRVDITQTEVADAAGVSKSTVVNRVYDVRDWVDRQQLVDLNYNRLKELASDNNVDVGDTPDRDYLIDRLVEAGVDE